MCICIFPDFVHSSVPGHINILVKGHQHWRGSKDTTAEVLVSIPLSFKREDP